MELANNNILFQIKQKWSTWQKLASDQKIYFVFFLFLLISAPLSLMVVLNPGKFKQMAQVPTNVQVETPPIADSFIAAYSPDKNYGRQSPLIVSRYNTDYKKGLLNFNLRGIPANSIILSAKLKLYISGWGGKKGTVDLSKVIRPWAEDGVTWNKASSSTNWEVPGAQGGKDIILTNAASFEINDINTWYEIDVRDLVNDWIANQSTGQGIILTTNTNEATFNINSRESNNQPKLSISYTSSGPTSPSPTPIPTGYRVFVTSTTYNGNLGGLEGADAKCQERANAANLGGSWKAWLSDNTTSVSSRFFHSTVPYLLLDGTIVAQNWNDLTDGNLLTNITLTETRSYHGNYVWTGTHENGEIHNPGTSKCLEWTALSNDSPSGPAGHSGYTDYQWTWGSNWNCATKILPLYCFEQPTAATPTPKSCTPYTCEANSWSETALADFTNRCQNQRTLDCLLYDHNCDGIIETVEFQYIHDNCLARPTVTSTLTPTPTTHIITPTPTQAISYCQQISGVCCGPSTSKCDRQKLWYGDSNYNTQGGCNPSGTFPRTGLCCTTCLR